MDKNDSENTLKDLVEHMREISLDSDFHFDTWASHGKLQPTCQTAPCNPAILSVQLSQYSLSPDW